VDQLLAQGRSVPGCDAAARTAVYEQLQQQAADDHPFTLLHMPNDTIAVNKRPQNVTPNPFSLSPYLSWSAKDWTVTT
jgi:ABC-type transport system substrate-binding protein